MTVSVLVPSSLTREAEDKREATRKLGDVARAATIYRVDRVIVFPDPEGETVRDGGFVSTVLRYAATPPYLRKEVWGRRDELEYAGVLPPLRATSRTGSGSNGSGSLRQGIVTQVGPEGRVRVNCGLQHPIALPVPAEMSVGEGERVTVRITSRRPVRAKLVDESPPGFAVERTDLDAALARPDAGVRIATSRHGEPLTLGRLEALGPAIDDDGLTVAFGAPERGLPEILGIDPETVASGAPTDGQGDRASAMEGDRARDDEDRVTCDPGFEHWLDTVPNQGSEVVRTEEALFATLACLALRA